MKNLLTTMLLFALAFGFTACSNDDDRVSTVFIDRAYLIDDDQNITVNLGPLGSETLTKIIVAPINAEISRLQVNDSTGAVEYFYEPIQGFIGEDIIRLETESGPIGDPDSNVIARYTLVMDVRN